MENKRIKSETIENNWKNSKHLEKIKDNWKIFENNWKKIKTIWKKLETLENN